MPLTKRKPITDYTDAELVVEAKANHIWLNAFSCIRPSDEFLIDVGRSVLRMLEDSEMGDSFGISQMVILTVNKS
jgi:hypothetical protein